MHFEHVSEEVLLIVCCQSWHYADKEKKMIFSIHCQNIVRAAMIVEVHDLSFAHLMPNLIG